MGTVQEPFRSSLRVVLGKGFGGGEPGGTDQPRPRKVLDDELVLAAWGVMMCQGEDEATASAEALARAACREGRMAAAAAGV